MGKSTTRDSLLKVLKMWEMFINTNTNWSCNCIYIYMCVSWVVIIDKFCQTALDVHNFAEVEKKKPQAASKKS